MAYECEENQTVGCTQTPAEKVTAKGSKMTTDNRMLRAALWYAAHGWHVIPLHTPLFDETGMRTGCSCEVWKRKKVHPPFVCETPGKHPRLSDWEEHATTDLATVAEWWRRWPNANVGIAAGKSGLLDLDLDTYKEDYSGADLLTLADEQTVTNLSGGGGAHLIYQMPEDAFYTNARGKLPSGIDIRGCGGQFVAPPSLHPSGRRYQWETGYGPHETDPLPLPQAICEILDDAVAASRNGDAQFVTDVEPPDFVNLRLKAEIVELIHHPPERGGRSEADQKVITALIHAGATDAEIRAIFTHYPIGKQGKFAEKGNNALRYLAHSITHARNWVQTRREEWAEQNARRFFQQVTLR